MIRQGIHSLRLAFGALQSNLLRALLTVLGIVIGIAAVIAMMQIGKGSTEALKKTISSMGANTLIILPGAAASGGVSFGIGSKQTLTPGDRDAIAAESSAVRSAAPVVRARTQVVYAGKNWIPNTIFGTTPEFLDVRDWTELAEGDAFSDKDVRSASAVCLIGQTIKRELFGDESPLGKSIRMQNVSLKVIGVLSRKGASMMGSDQDDVVLAPWTTIKNRVSGMSGGATDSSATAATQTTLNPIYPGGGAALYPATVDTNNGPQPARFVTIDQIQVAVRSTEEIPEAIDQITQLLRQRHRIRPGEPEDFNVRDMSEMINALSSTSTLMTNLLLCVALISLVVGGVGIMNVMLVSVTERTKEIGLRMAVGAKRRDILQQFLVESSLLCAIGGVLGIVLGGLASWLVNVGLGWPTETSTGAVITAVVVSITIGMVFGFYPAWRASNLDPIEALRYE